jgi:hypothetical protein
MGDFIHRNHPPGDHMNSLIHITHANAVNKQRLAARRRRTR